MSHGSIVAVTCTSKRAELGAWTKGLYTYANDSALYLLLAPKRQPPRLVWVPPVASRGQETQWLCQGCLPGKAGSSLRLMVVFRLLS